MNTECAKSVKFMHPLKLLQAHSKLPASFTKMLIKGLQALFANIKPLRTTPDAAAQVTWPWPK